MEEEQIIKISVRNLVEFILREGDIDNRTTGRMERDAMQQGSRIHRKIQKRMGSGYQAEVPLKKKCVCDGFILQVEGRADGIFTEERQVLIDEIKGVLRNLEQILEPVPVHLAQAKCYAYIYALQNGLEEIGVQMTYCNLETEEIKRFRKRYDLKELEIWFQNLICSYEKWAQFQVEWRMVRNGSIQRTEFPFTYREGQRELVVSVYRTILRKKKLFIQAPTGVGKTMAAIFPTVRAIGEGAGEKIFYLTAKTITRTVAEQAFQTLREQGLLFKTITLTAKEKICFCEETDCNPDACSYAKGHYDRVNDAVFDLITNFYELTRDVLTSQAGKYQVCPFEMALDASIWIDAIICDYNYVFDPNAHLRRFFSEGNKGGYLFLIDEAHNLVERGRKMYSAQIYKEDFLKIKRLVKGGDPKLAKQLEVCNKLLLKMKRECESERYQVLEQASHVSLKMMNVLGELENYLEECQDLEKRKEVLDFYFQVRMFLNIHDILDENYIIYTELEKDGRFKLKLLCVNPSVNLQSYLGQGNSTIFFSATLLPIHYYKKLLSVEKEDYAVYAESSFPKENRLILLGTDVSTKYTVRGPLMYQKIARYIIQTVRAKKGNYMVFFPSYRFLEDVYEMFQMETVDTEEIECVLQSQHMGEQAREIFLETFEEERENSLVGFCVMGGVFSEGIDLTQDRLIGAVIVGTGLPQVCNDREILREYFDSRNLSGFDYSYLYPGMNKVLQSAGRVIRTEEDQGIILLLDERFQGRQYQEMFPREWSGIQTCRLRQLDEKLKSFWGNGRI
ncbi:MAG: ATP-dependent DNA helicase [Ruminococcus sp.]|nr:ATP-dependent DNA helicase [Ruminococcus sp.]